MTGLLSLKEACNLLACRDVRTARKRLAALGVPVLTLHGRVLVDRGELDRAVRAHGRPLQGSVSAPAGVRLAPGERLWDGRSQVGPRAGRRRPRGDRVREHQVADAPYSGVSAAFSTAPVTTEEDR